MTTTEFPSVPERRAGPEPHAPRGRIHALQGPFEPIGARGRVESTRRQGHPVGTPAFQSSACATAQAFDHKTSVPAGKTSERREDQRTARRQAHGEKASAPGAPGTRTPNLTAPTGPTPSVRQPSSHPPALQRKHLTTRLAFPQERQADGRKTSGPQEDQRITGGPVRQECGNATYPATLTVGTADPGKGTHLLIILSLYRLIDRRCSSPPELVLAYRGRPPVGRP